MAAKMLCARGQRKLRKDFIRATNFNGFKWQLKLLYNVILPFNVQARRTENRYSGQAFQWISFCKLLYRVEEVQVGNKLKVK